MGRKYTLLIMICLFFGCKEKNEISSSDFEALTRHFYLFEESNRIIFRRLIVDEHLASKYSNSLNFEIIKLYDTLDVALEDLINQTGGYSPKTGELNGSYRQNLASKIMIENNVFNSINDSFKHIKKMVDIDSLEGGNDILPKIESCLFPILSGSMESDLDKYTNAQLFLELTIMQNRLLVTELEYYTLVRKSQKDF